MKKKQRINKEKRKEERCVKECVKCVEKKRGKSKEI